ncbi:hypothetical protein GCM10012285_24310 [Streptomyces kronopolitis]|uniref:Uncharacterized protein n=1 Tax=Streptomyces kronopolitis TaxID=1612435 RepID=A0ABQ2JCS7_9ACTN|nr:hypothetical protein GCM10012285_24310 [Streptomyces kronopolitis]
MVVTDGAQGARIPNVLRPRAPGAVPGAADLHESHGVQTTRARVTTLNAPRSQQDTARFYAAG